MPVFLLSFFFFDVCTYIIVAHLALVCLLYLDSLDSFL